jgi:thiamine biosynthesis lipoprotein ApbE
MRQEHSAEDSRAMKNFLPCVLVTGFLAASAGCVSTGRPALQRFDFSQAQMGLEFRLTLYAPNDATARAAAEAAYARIAALNGILSDYDADSELSRLSQSAGSGEWRTVSPELWRVLSAGQRLAQQSGGAFDLTVGPSVNLWRRARRQQQLPTAALLADMRERVGHEHLLLDPARRAAQLARPNMRLDAGGIAKGYALDEAMLVLREHCSSAIPRRAATTGARNCRQRTPAPARRFCTCGTVPWEPPAISYSLWNSTASAIPTSWIPAPALA